MRQLPCDVEAGRFLLRVPLPTGRVLRMLVDTGGGYAVDAEQVADLPRVATGYDDPDLGVDLPVDPPVVHGLGVAVPVPRPAEADGVLPAWWFADRVWTFDHVDGALWLHDHDDVDPPGSAAVLGFPEIDGRRASAFPRISVIIADTAIDLLLDTGATATLTDAGRGALGPGPTVRASSFITETTLTRWADDHRDWPTVTRPTTLAQTMIMVPSVSIPAQDGDAIELGSVWFESRPDASFRTWISQWTDRTVDGALGGNAFTGRRMVLDHPAGRLYLR